MNKKEFFQSREVCKMLSITPDQLSYWRRKKLIIPRIECHGRGLAMKYDEFNVVQIALISHLSKSGLHKRAIEKILFKCEQVDYHPFYRGIEQFSVETEDPTIWIKVDLEAIRKLIKWVLAA